MLFDRRGCVSARERSASSDIQDLHPHDGADVRISIFAADGVSILLCLNEALMEITGVNL